MCKKSGGIFTSTLSIIVLIICLSLTGCQSKVEVDLKTYCNEAMREIVLEVEDCNKDVNYTPSLDFLEKYKDYKLTEEEQEFYDYVSEYMDEMNELQLNRQKEDLDGIELYNNKMENTFDEIEKFCRKKGLV